MGLLSSEREFHKMQEQYIISGGINVLVTVVTAYMSCTYFEKYTQIVTSLKVSPQFIYI